MSHHVGIKFEVQIIIIIAIFITLFITFPGSSRILWNSRLWNHEG